MSENQAAQDQTRALPDVLDEILPLIPTVNQALHEVSTQFKKFEERVAFAAPEVVPIVWADADAFLRQATNGGPGEHRPKWVNDVYAVWNK